MITRLSTAIAANRFYAKPRAGRLWEDPELGTAQKLHASHGWNEPWAALYGDILNLKPAQDFLAESSRQRRKSSLLKWILVIVSVLALGAVAYAVESTLTAQTEFKLRKQAQDNLTAAQKASAYAKNQADAAVEAERAEKRAENSAQIAEHGAIQQAKLALAAKVKADAATALANKQARLLAEGQNALVIALKSQSHLTQELQASSKALTETNNKLQAAEDQLETKNRLLDASARIVAHTGLNEQSSLRDTMSLLISATKRLSDQKQAMSPADVAALKMLLFDSLNLQEIQLFDPIIQTAFNDRKGLLALANNGSVVVDLKRPIKLDVFQDNSWEFSIRALSFDGEYRLLAVAEVASNWRAYSAQATNLFE